MGPEEIFQFESQKMNNIYFILEGEVQLFQNLKNDQGSTQTITSLLRKGQMFGEARFITQSPLDYSAKTASITVLATIDRLEFESLIREYPFDMEVTKQNRF